MGARVTFTLYVSVASLRRPIFAIKLSHSYLGKPIYRSFSLHLKEKNHFEKRLVHRVYYNRIIVSTIRLSDNGDDGDN